MIEVIDNCWSFWLLLSEMQTELHIPGVEIWEAAAAATKSHLKSVALCLQLNAALKLILRVAFHGFAAAPLCYLLSGSDPPAGMDGARGWLGRRTACHELTLSCAGLLGHSSLWRI